MNRKLGAVTLLTGLAWLLAGCVAGDEAWEPFPQACGDQAESNCSHEQIVVAGVVRTLLLVTPDGASSGAPLPVVFVWHGSGTNGEYIRRRFAPPAVGGAPVLVVYPNGLPRPELSDRTGWNRDPTGNDVLFFDRLVDYLGARHGGDPNRVFSVGHSRGGRFVDVLACFRGSAHLALASISAGTGNVDDCPQRAPIWITHGRHDRYVGFRDGKDWVRRWARANGCDRVNPGVFPNDVGSELPGCEVPVVWFPHTSKLEAGHGPTPSAADEIPRFFARFM